MKQLVANSILLLLLLLPQGAHGLRLSSETATRDYEKHPFRVIDMAIDHKREGICAIVEERGVSEVQCFGQLTTNKGTISKVHRPHSLNALGGRILCAAGPIFGTCSPFDYDFLKAYSQSVWQEFYQIRDWTEKLTRLRAQGESEIIGVSVDKFRPCIVNREPNGDINTVCFDRDSESHLTRTKLDTFSVLGNMKLHWQNKWASDPGEPESVTIAKILDDYYLLLITETDLMIAGLNDRWADHPKYPRISDAPVRKVLGDFAHACVLYEDHRLQCKSVDKQDWIEKITVDANEEIIDFTLGTFAIQLLVRRPDGLVEYRSFTSERMAVAESEDTSKAVLEPKERDPFQGLVFSDASIFQATEDNSLICLVDHGSRKVMCQDHNQTGLDPEKYPIQEYTLNSVSPDRLYGSIFATTPSARTLLRKFTTFINDSELPLIEYIASVFYERDERQQYFLLSVLERFTSYHHNTTLRGRVSPILSAHVPYIVRQKFEIASIAEFASLQDEKITFDATKILEILLNTDLPELQAIVTDYPQLGSIVFPAAGEGPLGLSDRAILGLKESISPCIASRPQEIMSRQLACQQFLPPEDIDFNLNSALLPVAYELLDYFYGL